MKLKGLGAVEPKPSVLLGVVVELATIANAKSPRRTSMSAPYCAVSCGACANSMSVTLASTRPTAHSLGTDFAV